MVLVLRRETSRRPSDCGGLPRTRYRRLPANGGVRLEGSAWRARPSHGRSAVSQPSPWHLPNSPVPMTWVSRAGGERHPRVPDAAPGSEISSPAWQERAASWWHPSGGVVCQPVVCQPHEDHCALPWQPVLCHLPYRSAFGQCNRPFPRTRSDTKTLCREQTRGETVIHAASPGEMAHDLLGSQAGSEP